MTHWHTQDSLAREHRVDLDREAARAGLVAEAKASDPSAPKTPARPTAGRASGWIRLHAAQVAALAALRARFVR
jgi:hypothetical protein